MGIREDVRDVNDAYEKAVANQDISIVVSLYTSDAVLMPPNEPVAKGSKAMEAVFQRYVDAGASSLTLETLELEEQGDAVIEVGRYELGIQTPDGSMTDVGKYLQVFKRQADGTLRIAYDAFNSDLAAE
jgi:ketosteroid isomerase-like protein